MKCPTYLGCIGTSSGGQSIDRDIDAMLAHHSGYKLGLEDSISRLMHLGRHRLASRS